MLVTRKVKSPRKYTAVFDSLPSEIACMQYCLLWSHACLDVIYILSFLRQAVPQRERSMFYGLSILLNEALSYRSGDSAAIGRAQVIATASRDLVRSPEHLLIQDN